MLNKSVVALLLIFKSQERNIYMALEININTLK